MARHGGAVHVVTTRRHYKDKVYETVLLRRSYREAGKVKTETLANLSHLPPEAIEAVRASLAGQTLVAAAEGFEVERSLPHGHVAAVWAMARAARAGQALGPACAERDLALALVVARACQPASKLATTRWWASTTLGPTWAWRGRPPTTSTPPWTGSFPARATSRWPWHGATWPPGAGCSTTCRAAGWRAVVARSPRRGYSRDAKTGKAQIEYGLTCDPEGRPVAVEVFAGNTADPSAFISAAQAVASVRAR